MGQDEKTKIMPAVKKEDVDRRMSQRTAMTNHAPNGSGFSSVRSARPSSAPAQKTRPVEAKVAKEKEKEPQPIGKEMNNSAQKSRRSERHLPSPFSGLLLAIILIISIYALVTFSIGSTRIRRIDVVGEDESLNKEIVSITSHLEGKSYLFLNTKEEKKEILKKSPLIRNIEFKGKFPRTLKVIVHYEDPDFYIMTEDTLYTLNSDLKVLTKHEVSDNDFNFSGESLTKLSLPEFKEANAGEYLEFTSDSSYIKRVCDTLSDYDKFGQINLINLTNTQRIYFIFDSRFRCDLGDSQKLDVKLIAAENIYNNKLIAIKEASSERTAVINVSDPSFGSIRTDVDLGLND